MIKYPKYWEITTRDETAFLMLPLETVNYLRYNVRPHVVKIYVYLMQRYRFKQAVAQGEPYIFTYKEVAEHTGLNPYSKSTNDKIKYALQLLENSGLIEYETFKKKEKGGVMVTYRRLINASKYAKDSEKLWTKN